MRSIFCVLALLVVSSALVLCHVSNGHNNRDEPLTVPKSTQCKEDSRCCVYGANYFAGAYYGCEDMCPNNHKGKRKCPTPMVSVYSARKLKENASPSSDLVNDDLKLLYTPLNKLEYFADEHRIAVGIFFSKSVSLAPLVMDSKQNLSNIHIRMAETLRQELFSLMQCLAHNSVGNRGGVEGWNIFFESIKRFFLTIFEMHREKDHGIITAENLFEDEKEIISKYFVYFFENIHHYVGNIESEDNRMLLSAMVVFRIDLFPVFMKFIDDEIYQYRCLKMYLPVFIVNENIHLNQISLHFRGYEFWKKFATKYQDPDGSHILHKKHCWWYYGNYDDKADVEEIKLNYQLTE